MESAWEKQEQELAEAKAALGREQATKELISGWHQEAVEQVRKLEVEVGRLTGALEESRRAFDRLAVRNAKAEERVAHLEGRPTWDDPYPGVTISDVGEVDGAEAQLRLDTGDGRIIWSEPLELPKGATRVVFNLAPEPKL